MTFFSVTHNALVTFYLQNVLVLSNISHILPTYFQKLTSKTCWSELYLAIGLSTPLLQEKKLDFELCKHSPHFTLIIIFKWTFPHWIEWVLVLHSLSACCDVTFVKSTINLVLKNILLGRVVQSAIKLTQG